MMILYPMLSIKLMTMNMKNNYAVFLIAYTILFSGATWRVFYWAGSIADQ